MKKISILWMSMLLLMLAGCSSDDENDDGIVSPSDLAGKWMVAHKSTNPDYYDTHDMWPFIFNADGTGSSYLCTGQFTYEIKGYHIFLSYLPSDSYLGQLEFEYEIESYTHDHMEWQEIKIGNWGNITHHLTFYRSN